MNPLDSGISGSGIVTFAMNVGGNPGLPDAINDIEWALLGLTEDAPQVFAEHPNEEQLHATETQHGDDQRRVPAHRLAPDEVFTTIQPPMTKDAAASVNPTYMAIFRGAMVKEVIPSRAKFHSFQ